MNDQDLRYVALRYVQTYIFIYIHNIETINAYVDTDLILSENLIYDLSAFLKVSSNVNEVGDSLCKLDIFIQRSFGQTPVDSNKFAKSKVNSNFVP